MTIYGLLSSMLNFVPAVGPIAGSVVSEAFGWQAIFLSLGAIALLAMLNAVFRWNETRPPEAVKPRNAFSPILRSAAFWTYTLGFSAAMGTFFVFFSTAPRVLIDVAGYSEMQFSLSFATVAVVMIVTARFAKRFVGKWGIPGSLVRGMATLLLGAVILGCGQMSGPPSFFTFVMPMWVMALGIVFTVSVTANGALAEFDDVAGSAVALYFCVQSLFVSIIGSLAVISFNGNTAWPLVVYTSVMALLVLSVLRSVQLHGR